MLKCAESIIGLCPGVGSVSSFSNEHLYKLRWHRKHALIAKTLANDLANALSKEITESKNPKADIAALIQIAIKDWLIIFHSLYFWKYEFTVNLVVELAELYRKTDAPSDGRNVLSKIIINDTLPNGIVALRGRADYYRFIKDRNSELADRDMICRLDPHRYQSFSMRATVFRYLGRSEEALKDINTAINLFETRHISKRASFVAELKTPNGYKTLKKDQNANSNKSWPSVTKCECYARLFYERGTIQALLLKDHIQAIHDFRRNVLLFPQHLYVSPHDSLISFFIYSICSCVLQKRSSRSWIFID
jgi:tetratricopeptide (TPR) repeat protein